MLPLKTGRHIRDHKCPSVKYRFPAGVQLGIDPFEPVADNATLSCLL